MIIVFGIDGRGQLSEVGRMLQLAIKSCKANTSHTPVVIADHFRPDFRAWLDEMNVRGIEVPTPMTDAIIAANQRSGYPLQAIGNYIRYEACSVVDDQTFLYCDCDTIFIRDFFISEKPSLVSAVTEDNLNDWSRFNSGVLLINREALIKELPNFYAYAAERLEEFYPGFDQAAFNGYFQGRIERLSPSLNWRPYWGYNPDAAILHTHGVKPTVAMSMLNGAFVADRTKRQQIQELAIRTMRNLPAFEEHLIPFSDDVIAKLWLMIAQKAKEAINAPLNALISQTEAVREDLLSKWRAGELAMVTRAMEARELLPVSFSLSNGQTNLRLVLCSKTLFVILSNPVDVVSGAQLDIAKCTTGNVAECNDMLVDGLKFHIISKIDGDLPVDLVFNAKCDRAGDRAFSLKVLQHGLTSIRRFWSDNGIFSEAEAEDISLI